jgi:hypothetical protein
LAVDKVVLRVIKEETEVLVVEKAKAVVVELMEVMVEVEAKEELDKGQQQENLPTLVEHYILEVVELEDGAVQHLVEQVEVVMVRVTTIT